MGDDFEIEDAVIVGGFLGMVEEEEEEEKKRRKLEEELVSESGGGDWEDRENDEDQL